MAKTLEHPESSAREAVSARERVYLWLRDEIIMGGLPGGQFLDEAWVSESVGTSRTPVREAFHRLNSERFIDLLPRKGAQVRTVTARELEEVYATRRLIEGHAARELCLAGRGAPAQMSELATGMENAGREADWFQVAQMDRQFHRAIVSAHDNSILTELYDALRSRQQRVAVRAMQTQPERVSVINSQHRAIIDALAANDNDAVQAFLSQHLHPVPEIVAALGY